MRELVVLLVLSTLNAVVCIALWLNNPANFYLYMTFLVSCNGYFLWRAEKIVEKDKKNK